MSTDTVAIPTRLRELARTQGDQPAATDDTRTLTYAEIYRDATKLARVYLDRGVQVGDIVTIAMPSDTTMLVAILAAWFVGATPQGLSPTTPPAELAAIVEVSKPGLVVGVEVPGAPCLLSTEALTEQSDEPLPDVMSPAWKAPTSGGSTGRPKVIVAAAPANVPALLGFAALVRIRPGDTTLMTAPMHHNAPFMWSALTLLQGGHVVLAGRFDPERTLELLDQHKIDWVYVVPTMMSRIAKLPDDVRAKYDVSTVHTAYHMAAPCPVWVKEHWIGWLGADAICELYAGTEGQAATTITGTEWLEHRGSVGTVQFGEMVILDDDGDPVPAGTTGEIWLRAAAGATYSYLGADAKVRDGGWESLGDIGHFDADGYLYISDRLADMVLVGGVNVFPAEIEAALEEHPAVDGSVVIGLPDDDLGNRLHALVHLSSDVDDATLAAWCTARLSKHKVPRTFERVDQPLRNESAKVQRGALRAARLAPSS